MPNFFATSSVCCWLPPVSETTCTSSIFCSASRCLIPKAPCPATTILITLAMVSLLTLVLENQVSERRVRRGHVIETVDLLHVALESATRDQPHDELDGLRAGLANVFDKRNLRIGLRIFHEVVEEARVPFLVDEPGACALQLVRHAPRAEDDDAQILRKGFDGFLDSLAEVEAAVAGRRRILHDVDGERDNLARPLFRLPEHQRQRYGEAVIHVHL